MLYTIYTCASTICNHNIYTVYIVGKYCGCIRMYCGCIRICCGQHCPLMHPQYIRVVHNIYRSCIYCGCITLVTHNMYPQYIQTPTMYTHNTYTCIYCGYTLRVLHVYIVGAILLYILWVQCSFTDVLHGLRRFITLTPQYLGSKC